jgi:hypothetical protein
MRVRILSVAENDLEDGYRFYESQLSGLGSYFLDSLYSDIDSLAFFGGIHPMVFGYHRQLSNWDKTKTHAGISKDRFFEYFRDKPKGYAIEVKTTQIYNTPLTLNRLLIASPPQSFMYLW